MITKKIKYKILVTIVTLTVFFFLSFLLVLNSSLRKMTFEQIENKSGLIGKNAAEALRQPLFYGDYTLLRNIVDPLFGEDIAYIIVYDAQTGRIAYSKSSREYELLVDELLLRINQAEAKQPATKVTLADESFLEYIFPVILGGRDKPFGHVVIGVSQKSISTRLRTISRQIGLLGLAVLVVMVFFIFLLSTSLTRPIGLLTKTITSFSAGDLKARSPIRTGDEIEILSEAFNLMAAKINEQIASIEKYSHELESMVEERTVKWKSTQDELQQKEIALLRAEKMQGLNMLVGSIAHEINNPLAIISGNLQFLEKDAGDRERRIKKIDQAVLRISKLIGDLTFFASLREVTLKTLAVDSLLRELSAELIPHDIKVGFEGQKEMNIWANENMLRLAFTHLINNSVEELHEKSLDRQITMRLFEDNANCIIQVADNGRGFMEPERVFEPFYTNKPEKKGLGLTYVYHIVHLHSGEVKVENLGSGGQVTITLPK